MDACPCSGWPSCSRHPAATVPTGSLQPGGGAGTSTYSLTRDRRVEKASGWMERIALQLRSLQQREGSGTVTWTAAGHCHCCHSGGLSCILPVPAHSSNNLGPAPDPTGTSSSAQASGPAGYQLQEQPSVLVTGWQGDHGHVPWVSSACVGCGCGPAWL